MIKTKKIVATALSAAMAASMCVAVPATAAFAADGNGIGAAATDNTQDGAELIDVNDVIKSDFKVYDKFYNGGKAVEPLASIKDTVDNSKLIAGTDYDVVYSDNTNIGTATAVITGKGKYKGTKTVTFKIVDFTFDVLYEGKTLNSLSKAQIEKLTKESTDNDTDLYYQYKNKVNKSFVCYVPAKTYVTVASIMKAEGVASWGGVKVTATDNMGTTVTAADDSQRKFFPGQTAESTSITDGAFATPAVIADSYSEVEVTTTAAEAATAAKAAYDTSARYGQSKVFTGATESEYLAGSLPGSRLITDICRFNILGEYSMLKSNPVKVAKTKASVAKGKSVAVKVSKAQGKVTVSSSAKKVAKVSYSAKTGKVTIKGLKKGTAKVTVKAAGNKTYKAGTKTIKVTVK